MVPSSGADGVAAVHSLVIGVGHYAMPAIGDLASAGDSALLFADWLHDHQQVTGLVRGSIDVLAIGANGSPLKWQGITLDAPTLANVVEAVDAFHARVDVNPDNLAVFYFCGHAVQIGDLRSLLLADVDLGSRVEPFRNAIAFEKFLHNMGSCGARRQIYVLDACRQSTGYKKWADNEELGNRLVAFDSARRAELKESRTYVVLDAASESQRAWAGKTGGWFTEALLLVLKGAAADNRLSDDYTVSTRDIADTVCRLVDKGFIEPPVSPQTPKRWGDGDTDFHFPKGRLKVPVLVTDKDPTVNGGGRFVAVRADTPIATAALPWRDVLEVGGYRFQRLPPDPIAGAETATPATGVDVDVIAPASRVELP